MKTLILTFSFSLYSLCILAQTDSSTYWNTLITDTNSDFRTIVNLQDKYFANHLDSAGDESGNQSEYIRFKTFWQSRVYNSGQASSNIFNALKNYKAVYDNLNLYYDENNNPNEDWKYLGPKGFSTQNYGIIICVKADISDPLLNTLYAGSGASGLWKTTDGGSTWKNITRNSLPSGLGVYDIVINPNDPKVIYIATGFNGDLRAAYYYGKGILRTADGGESWTEANMDPPITFSDKKPITKLLMDPVNPSRILAFGENYMYRTMDGIHWGSVPNLDPDAFCNSGPYTWITPKIVRDADFDMNNTSNNAIYVTTDGFFDNTWFPAEFWRIDNIFSTDQINSPTTFDRLGINELANCTRAELLIYSYIRRQ